MRRSVHTFLPASKSTTWKHCSSRAFIKGGTHVVEGFHLTGPGARVADSVEESIVLQHWHKLFEMQHEQHRADGGEHEVVDLVDFIELKGGTPLHELPTSKDDSVVRNENGCRLLEGGYWRRPGCEFEVGCRVPGNAVEGIVEYRPERL